MRLIDADKLFEYIQKEKAWKQGTMRQPRYGLGKYDAYYEMLSIIKEQSTVNAQEWTPVNLSLPKEDGTYLVTVKNLTGYWILKSNVFECKYYEKEWYFNGWEDNSVIAWMKRPEEYIEV